MKIKDSVKKKIIVILTNFVGKDLDIYRVYPFRAICASCGTSFDGEGCCRVHDKKIDIFEQYFVDLCKSRGWVSYGGYTICPACAELVRSGEKINCADPVPDQVGKNQGYAVVKNSLQAMLMRRGKE